MRAIETADPQIHPLTHIFHSLANCEIYLALAAVFRPSPYPTSPLQNANPDVELAANPKVLRLELFETDGSDVEIAHDFFNPVPRLDSKGVRVMVT